jgi:hypothetical protein
METEIFRVRERFRYREVGQLDKGEASEETQMFPEKLGTAHYL